MLDPRSSNAYRAARARFLRSRHLVCHWCGREVSDKLPMSDPAKATVDHLVEVDQSPRQALDVSLWVVACAACNYSRGSRYRHRKRRAQASALPGAFGPSRRW